MTKKLEKNKKPAFDLPGNSVFFISLGCPRNLVDTEVMIGTLLKHGYIVSDSLEKSDFIVINTCGFLEKSRTESIETIQEVLHRKKQNAQVIVTGCMVQIQKNRLEEECPGVHFYLGSGDAGSILKALEAKQEGSLVTDAASFLEMGEVPRTLSTPKHYAYLKIAEGCRKRCSYCIIPTIKGGLKSKPIEQIIKEMQILIAQGVKEIILIAQDLGDWGKDLGFKRSHGLCHLLQEMVREEGDFRIRLLYLYPDEITDELITLIQATTKIIPYLDMPIQHINNDVLQRMHRATTKEQILSIIEKLRAKIPHIAIRTSLIVGFPGETDEQFQELCDFVKTGVLDNVGIFEYSKEDMSLSATLNGHLSDAIKQKRAKKLALIQKKVVEKKNKSMIGKFLNVVIEGFHPESKNLLIGRHDGQCPEIDGIVIINDGRIVDSFGKRYSVEITDAFEYDLVGKAIREIQ